MKTLNNLKIINSNVNEANSRKFQNYLNEFSIDKTTLEHDIYQEKISALERDSIRKDLLLFNQNSFNEKELDNFEISKNNLQIDDDVKKISTFNNKNKLTSQNKIPSFKIKENKSPFKNPKEEYIKNFKINIHESNVTKNINKILEKKKNLEKYKFQFVNYDPDNKDYQCFACLKRKGKDRKYFENSRNNESYCQCNKQKKDSSNLRFSERSSELNKYENNENKKKNHSKLSFFALPSLHFTPNEIKKEKIFFSGDENKNIQIPIIKSNFKNDELIHLKQKIHIFLNKNIIFFNDLQLYISNLKNKSLKNEDIELNNEVYKDKILVMIAKYTNFLNWIEDSKYDNDKNTFELKINEEIIFLKDEKIKSLIEKNNNLEFYLETIFSQKDDSNKNSTSLKKTIQKLLYLEKNNKELFEKYQIAIKELNIKNPEYEYILNVYENLEEKYNKLQNSIELEKEQTPFFTNNKEKKKNLSSSFELIKENKQDEIDYLKSYINDLEEKLMEINNEYNQLKEHEKQDKFIINIKNDQIEELRQNTIILEKNLKNYESKNLSHSLDIPNEQNYDYSEINYLNEENFKLKQKISEIEILLEQKEKNRNQTEINSFNEEILKLKNKILELEILLEQKEKIILEKIDEIDHLNNINQVKLIMNERKFEDKIQELNSEINFFKISEEKLQNEIRRLESENIEKRREINDIEIKINDKMKSEAMNVEIINELLLNLNENDLDNNLEHKKILTDKFGINFINFLEEKNKKIKLYTLKLQNKRDLLKETIKKLIDFLKMGVIFSNSLLYIIEILNTRDNSNQLEQLKISLKNQKEEIYFHNQEMKDQLFEIELNQEKEFNTSIQNDDFIIEENPTMIRDSDIKKLEKYDLLKKENSNLKLELDDIKKKIQLNLSQEQFNVLIKTHQRKDSLKDQLDDCIKRNKELITYIKKIETKINASKSSPESFAENRLNEDNLYSGLDQKSLNFFLDCKNEKIIAPNENMTNSIFDMILLQAVSLEKIFKNNFEYETEFKET